MLASQRRAAIIAALARSGAVRVADLTARFDVADMTIRRDLAVLEEQGRLRRVHGGAVATGSSADEPGFEAKRGVNVAAKRAIAARAAQLVVPGAAIGISAGTTTWMLAGELVGGPRPLSVVTNSTTVADVLAGSAGGFGVADGIGVAGAASVAGIAGAGGTAGVAGAGGLAGIAGAVAAAEVLLTGGLRTPSAALVGPIAERAIADLHVDRLFLGVHGMDARAGLTTPNLAEAQTNAALIAHAGSVVVLADSSKWGTVGLAGIAPLTAVDVLITDDGLPAEAREALADQVGELLLVPVV